MKLRTLAGLGIVALLGAGLIAGCGGGGGGHDELVIGEYGSLKVPWITRDLAI